MNETGIRTAKDIDETALNAFLRRHFAAGKADFLARHGEWWHRGQHNRWVIAEGGDVVAYCAVIPTTLLVGGEPVEAAWWVDLVVDEANRGRGLQTLFDRRVRSAAPLIIGFPNALAAAIHRRHGWGVRDDLEVRLLPLRPRAVAQRRVAAAGGRAWLLLAAVAAEPYARWTRRRLRTYRPRWSGVVEGPSAAALARIAEVGRERDVTTTHRDAAYLEWRYLQAPYRDELTYVVGGRDGRLALAAVLRVTSSRGATVARVLDLFGDLSRQELVSDVLALVSQQALALGACQVTALAGTLESAEQLRRAGFLVTRETSFCWQTGSEHRSTEIEASVLHFVLADSDNDAA